MSSSSAFPPMSPGSSMQNNPQAHNVHNLFASARAALASSSESAIFTVGGTVSGHASDPRDTAASTGSQPATNGSVTVRWDSRELAHGRKVAFPVQQAVEAQAALARLVQDCQPATFGRNDQEVFDETYRKAGKMDEAGFSTNFNPYEHGIIDTVLQSLAHIDKSSDVNRGVRAELYKLNIYSAPSGRFKPHVDTPRSEQQMGSLVICLPHPHKGGQLAVRHRDQEVTYDWSTDSPTRIQWAAFFSDCEHEVREVTEGHRVTLTYNLYWTPYGPTSLADQSGALAEESLLFYSSPERLLGCHDFLPKGGLVGFTCTHAYPHTSDSRVEVLHHGLKGIDMLLYQALKRLVGADAVRVQAAHNTPENNYYRRHRPVQAGSKDPISANTKKTLLTKPCSTDLYDFNPDREDGYNWESEDELKYGPGSIDPYIRREVTWLNHKPGRSDHTELAIALLTYGNEPGLDSHYSSMVITAELGGFSDNYGGRQRS